MDCEETNLASLMASTTPQVSPPIWWKLVVPFCGTHLAAAYGIYRRPPSTVSAGIWAATFLVYQLATYGCVYM